MLHKLLSALGVWTNCWKPDHFTVRYAPGFFHWSTSLLNPTNYRCRQAAACLASLKEVDPQPMNILLHWAVSPYHKNGFLYVPRAMHWKCAQGNAAQGNALDSCSPSCYKAACISTSLSSEQLFILCRRPGASRECCRSGFCGKRLRGCPALDTGGYSHLQRTHHTTQLCPAEKVMVPGGMSSWGKCFPKKARMLYSQRGKSSGRHEGE